MRTEDGGIISDGIQVGSTLQCPHCGKHFLSIPGSGNRRAFCLKCHAVTCGSLTCDPCIPQEARLEFFEGKKTLYDDLIKDELQKGAILL